MDCVITCQRVICWTLLLQISNNLYSVISSLIQYSSGKCFIYLHIFLLLILCRFNQIKAFHFYQPRKLSNVDKLPLNYPSVTHLKFDIDFNGTVDNNNLPSSLTHLIFGHSFDKPANNLPPSLTHLTFGHRFNQPVNFLPLSLTHLQFKYYFNHPIDNLSHKITHLKLGAKFN